LAAWAAHWKSRGVRRGAGTLDLVEQEKSLRLRAIWATFSSNVQVLGKATGRRLERFMGSAPCGTRVCARSRIPRANLRRNQNIVKHCYERGALILSAGTYAEALEVLEAEIGSVFQSPVVA
jgi:hypothetical protein